jgi:hypothetical protein
VSVNEKKWLVMHMHVQLQLDIYAGGIICDCRLHRACVNSVRQLERWLLER